MERNDVLKGLYQHCEGSMFDRCGECPYYKYEEEPFACRDIMIMDAYAMLKFYYNEQNPHILTLDEIHSLEPGANIWIEWLDEEDMHRGIELGVITPEEEIRFNGSYAYLKRYKPTWTDDFKERVWSAKPSKELRDSTPWEEI